MFCFEIGLQGYLSLFGGYFGRASDHETAPIEGIFGSAAYHDREVIIVEPELNLFDRHFGAVAVGRKSERSEEHTSELQSLMRNSYAVFCLKKKNTRNERQSNALIKQASHN